MASLGVDVMELDLLALLHLLIPPLGRRRHDPFQVQVHHHRSVHLHAVREERSPLALWF
jgi:hypothetical protein